LVIEYLSGIMVKLDRVPGTLEWFPKMC
jgi:hypothetical protein